MCDAEQNVSCDCERCCRPCPGASFDQRFTSGDVKGMPCGISEVISEYRRARTVVKLSHHVSSRTYGAGQHADPAGT